MPYINDEMMQSLRKDGHHLMQCVSTLQQLMNSTERLLDALEISLSHMNELDRERTRQATARARLLVKKSDLLLNEIFGKD